MVRKYKHPVIESEERNLVNQVMDSAMFSGYRASKSGAMGGEMVQAFENEFKAYHDTKHAIAFSSATTALHAALIACRIGLEDRVLTTPLTFSASASCIEMVGGVPVFCDIEPDTFNMNPYHAKGIKAIIPVHLMGHPCDMDNILDLAEEYGLKIIEDACQSIGAEYHGKKVGTFGHCGVFSFNQSKPISVGEGGMLITDDDDIAEKSRAIRNHGEVSTDLGILGYNYRMGELEAALGLAQFRKLDSRNDHRIMLANHLTEALNKIDGLTPPMVKMGCKHTYFTYGVKVDIGMAKRELQQILIDNDVYFGLGDYKPLNLFPYYGGVSMPIAEQVSEEVMFTDVLRYPMTIEDVDEMIEVINETLCS